MCVATPRLYGQLELHKQGQPIRPVVAYYTAPTYKLAKYLAIWFKEVTGYVSSYTIKNSIELANKLQGLSFPRGSRLISFDAVSMFTRIPVKYTIDIMLEFLKKAAIQQEIIDEFHKLIKLCLNDNICFFLGKTYRFPDGLPMGAPLSMLVADIFMDHLKSSILTSQDSSISNILFYARYVDDVICVWNGSDN